LLRFYGLIWNFMEILGKTMGGNGDVNSKS